MEGTSHTYNPEIGPEALMEAMGELYTQEQAAQEQAEGDFQNEAKEKKVSPEKVSRQFKLAGGAFAALIFSALGTGCSQQQMDHAKQGLDRYNDRVRATDAAHRTMQQTSHNSTQIGVTLRNGSLSIDSRDTTTVNRVRQGEGRSTFRETTTTHREVGNPGANKSRTSKSSSGIFKDKKDNKK